MNESSIAVLRATLDSASASSGWATLAVTFGVAIELVALFAFSKEMPKSEKVVLAAATLLIAVGCGAEYYYGGVAATAADRLQQDTQSKASAAILDAGNASERAANLEIRAAQAEKDAANAKAEQARLQARVVWRQLSDLQCRSILSVLSTGEHDNIVIQYVDGDPEAETYAIAIANCIGSPPAGWGVAMAADSWQGLVPFSIIIGGELSPSLSLLKQGFSQAGLAYSEDDSLLVSRRSRCSGACGMPPLRLTVGSRPIGN